MEKEIYGLVGVALGILLKAFFDFVRIRLDHKHSEKMYKLENQGKENIKELLLEMLNHRTHIDRTFDALKKRIGGYSDDELRKLLIEAGAQKVRSNTDGKEMWYLTSRQEERNRKRATNAI